MRARRRRTGTWAALFALGTAAAPAVATAQAPDAPDAPGGEDGAPAAGGQDAASAADAPEAGGTEASAKAAPDAFWDPREPPLEDVYFLGARFRNVVVPKFMINLFADGGQTVNVFTFGPELTLRKDGTEFDVGLSYADYSMPENLFKSADDGDEGFEIVSSSLKAVYLTVDLLKEFPLDDRGRFSILVGGGVGLGVVFGDLHRTQAEPLDPAHLDRENVGAWRKCAAPGGFWCDPSNDHYPTDGEDFSEPSWANGGGKPFVFPWLALPQVSFRYKPFAKLQTRTDLGFSLTGFYFGLGAGYRL